MLLLPKFETDLGAKDWGGRRDRGRNTGMILHPKIPELQVQAPPWLWEGCFQTRARTPKSRMEPRRQILL